MDIETFNISQDDHESDTSQEDLDDSLMTTVGDHQSQNYNQIWDDFDNMSKQTYSKWARKKESIQLLNDDNDDDNNENGQNLRFMLLDSDFSIISTNKIDPCIVSILPKIQRCLPEQSYNRLYGITKTGCSILINVFGFLPYFYALPSNNNFSQDSMAHFQNQLNEKITKDIKSRIDLVVPYHEILEHTQPILNIELVNVSDSNIYDFCQQSPYVHYSDSDESDTDKNNGIESIKSNNEDLPSTSSILTTEKMEKTIIQDNLMVDVDIIDDKAKSSKLKKSTAKILKIYCSMPKFVWTAVKILNKNLITYPVLNNKPCFYQTFEGSINHNIRFLTDLNLSGCSWLEILPGNFFRRTENSKLSHCQLEFDCHYKSINSLSSNSTLSTTIPPLKILSFDIECMTRPPNYKFPRNGSDLVLQIGSVLSTFKPGSNNKEMEKFIFMLGSSNELEGTTIFSFEKEVEMLEAWRLFVVTIDPDILTGYNIKKFDLPFLLDRARVIKANRFPLLGRIQHSESNTKRIQNSNKKPIKYDTTSINISGRIIFDMMILIIRHDTKPGGSFKLGDVSRRYLQSQETKEEFSYKDIFKYQNMGPSTRQILASYCVQDSKLPYLIMLEHQPNPAKNPNFNTLEYYIDKARVSGTPLRYLVTKSLEYNTYYKMARKHKNPSVIFVPNTPPKKLTPSKRRNSAPPELLSSEEGNIIEHNNGFDLIFSSNQLYFNQSEMSSSLPSSSSPSLVTKKLCVGKKLFNDQMHV